MRLTSSRLWPSWSTASHLFLIAVILCWAFVLALPYPTFVLSHAYDTFTNTYPYTEEGWSRIFLGIALAGMPGLIPAPREYGGLRLAIVMVRVVTRGLLGAAHCGISGAMLSGDLGAHGVTTGPLVYTLVAGYALYAIVMEL